MVRDPGPLAPVAARGHAFACALQAEAKSSGMLEGLLQRAAIRRVRRKARPAALGSGENPRFPVAQATPQILWRGSEAELTAPIDLPRARDVLKLTERAIERGDEKMRPVAATIRIEIALAEAELFDLAQANKRLDLIKVKGGFSFTASIVGGRSRIELPAIRLPGAVM